MDRVNGFVSFDQISIEILGDRVEIAGGAGTLSSIGSRTGSRRRIIDQMTCA
jgi:hypothetical protein